MRCLFHFAASAALFVVVTAAVEAQAPLSKESPFLPPPGSVEAPASGKENLSLTGVTGSGKNATVCIVDAQAKHVYWIPVGTTTEGIKVLNYDTARDQAVISVGGQEKILTLRAATVTNAGAGVGSFSAPAPAPVASTLPAPTQGTPQPPPVPGSIAHQETEARMLVSDLLEIGMQQRKAYEEAQKKAAEEKKKS